MKTLLFTCICLFLSLSVFGQSQKKENTPTLQTSNAKVVSTAPKVAPAELKTTQKKSDPSSSTKSAAKEAPAPKLESSNTKTQKANSKQNAIKSTGDK